MTHAPRCQSCGLLLPASSSNKTHEDYCAACYRDGAFSEPGLTVHDMVERYRTHMVRHEHMDDDRAEILAQATVPTLKRWRHS